MTNAETNTAFLNAIPTGTKNHILESIASHYGITHEEVIEEVTAPEAEHLLDYLTGHTREAVASMMKGH